MPIRNDYHQRDQLIHLRDMINAILDDDELSSSRYDVLDCALSHTSSIVNPENDDDDIESAIMSCKLFHPSALAPSILADIE